jgi:hypothetical protein
MELLGVIEATHQHRVVDQVERHIKSIAGTCVACGIARYYYARISEVPAVSIDDAPRELHLDASVGSLAAGLVFGLSEDFDEVATQRIKEKGLTDALLPILKRITYVITSTDARAAELRSAANLYADAVAMTDPGKCVAFALMALEAVLLERSNVDNIIARLKEATAYRLGRSPDTRAQIRRQVGRLYDFRSSFVHTGEVRVTEAERRASLELIGSVLKREIEDLQMRDDALLKDKPRS